MTLRVRGTNVSSWLIPLMYAGGAILGGFSVPRLSYVLWPGFVSTISVNAAIGIYSAVASGMLSLTGIVFALTFVMVQFSATAYSPRLVLWIARDPVISHATGVFTATFLYAIASLAWVDRFGPSAFGRSIGSCFIAYRERHLIRRPDSASEQTPG